MFVHIRHWFRAPTFESEEKNRQARLLNAVLGFDILALILLAFLPLVFHSSHWAAGLVLDGCSIALHIFAWLMLRRGHIENAAKVLIYGMGLLLTLTSIFFPDILRVLFSGYIVIILAAALLIDWKAGLITFALSTSTSGLIIFLERRGLFIEFTQATSPLIAWVEQTIIFIWILFLVYIGSKSYLEVAQRARRGEVALQSSYSELESVRSSLEAYAHDLERRIIQLQVASDVARDAATLQEVEPLLDRAVNLVRDRFGFYHAGIFMIDDASEYAMLKSATGEAGRNMVKSGHKLKVGEVGIVGYVTGTGQPRIALDVGVDAVYFQNPLLPETRSELALPLKTGGIVIGALDVQSQQAAAFDEDDISILQTMADQLAVAIANARLFEATHRQLEELRALNAVSTAGAIATSEDELIASVTSLIAEVFFPNNFGIMLLDVGKQHLKAHPSYRTLNNLLPPNVPLGQGISGMVAQDGLPRRFADVTQNPAYLCIDSATLSELCVPISINDEVIGVINAESSQLNFFSANDERLLATIAGQLATAMQKIRLYASTQRRAAELESLRRASLSLTSNLNLQDLLEVILHQAIQLVTSDTAHLFLYDGENLTFGAAYWKEGYPQELHDKPNPQGTTYRVARSGMRLVIPDISQSELFTTRPWDGALVSLPISLGGRVLGVMNLAHHGDPHEFDENELRVLELLADQAALALNNATLYNEAQERARELAAALAEREELDRIKNEFIQNASHELRTPLAIARGYIELLNNQELGDLSKEQQDAVNILFRRVNMLIRIVDDLVAILEAEGHDIVREEVILNDLALKNVEDFRDAAARAELELICKVPQETISVMGNYSHLNRLLDNLMANAIKFTPPEGAITLTVHQEGDQVIIEVADTGIGISPDKIDRIFDRFYQVDGSTKRRFGGIGLGLALVKEIVQAHGGTIRVRSDIGVGSTFTVTLPTRHNPQS